MADVNAKLMSSPLPYANADIPANWENRNILQVKIEVYSSGLRQACFVFNGQKSTVISWMSRDRLICSSYQAPDHEKLDLLDVAGEAPFRFSVHETRGGCEGTCGFLSAVEPGSDCPSLAGGPVRPYFLYSTRGSSCARWHRGDEYGIGDLFVVSVLMCDLNS
ncbi:uncharacterized protein LOC135465393 [Liolophura sinensis]|uniref:uncharacterized protein LOC135465393 n=1 Tax=Liolophura sinensis TaxID=3198878 RepID=UPI0031582BA0